MSNEFDKIITMNLSDWGAVVWRDMRKAVQERSVED